MVKFIFQSILALLMLGLVFGVVGAYLWETTGEGDYTAPDRDGNGDSVQSGGSRDSATAEGLEIEGYFDSMPQWSPDGQFIVFESDRMQNEDVWMVSSTGSAPVNLTADSPSSDSNPVWSPDSQLIAFISERSGNADIWMMSADGSNPINLTSENADGDFQPQWSTDGQYIAYLARVEERIQLQVVNVENGENTSVTEASDRDYIAFDWSPYGLQLITVEENVNDDTTRLVMFSVDGFLLQIYQPTRTVIDVQWSPDGSRFLLGVAGESESSEVDLIVMGFDGSEQEIILPEHSGGVGNWSPDGDSIILSTIETLTHSSIWIVDADGSNIRNLTGDFSISLAVPVWSPDGTKIACAGRQGEEGNFDIWVMDADGSNLVNLTGGE